MFPLNFINTLFKIKFFSENFEHNPLENTHPFESINKRYLKVDQHLARHFVYFGECLSNPPLFLSSQIITPFLNSMIYTNHEKGFSFQRTLIPLI